MPIALDPNQTFPIWLESDKDAKPRPEFLFRALTIRDRQRVFELPERFKADDSITAEEVVKQSVELFTEFCKGWTNMGDHKYSAESVKSVLTHGELWELLFAAAEGSRVSHDEKKSSES